MDNNLKEVVKKRVERTIRSLQKRNMNGYFVENETELKELLNQLIEDKQVVSVGGSMTLFETGVIDYLRERDIEFLDRYKKGITPAEKKQVYRDAFSADVYLSSTNAITEKGELYNVDGTGNRVAAMIYGPDKVIVVTGYNKIVKDIDEAIDRNKQIAAPANVIRLNMNNPCKETGFCVKCNSQERICNIYTVIDRQFNSQRMHVVIVNDQFGY